MDLLTKGGAEIWGFHESLSYIIISRRKAEKEWNQLQKDYTLEP
jgi:hypothetical protein